MKIFINTNDWTISKIENETPIVTGDNYVDTINVYYNNDPAYLNIIPTLNLLKPNNRKVGSIPFDVGTVENPNPSSYTDEDSNTWYRFVFTLSSDNGQIDEKGKYQCTIVTNYLDTSGNITAQRNVNVQFNVFNAVKNENSNIFILSESNPDNVIADVYQLVQTLSTSVSALGLSKVDKADIGYIEITYNGPVVQTITGTLTTAQLAEASKKYCILRLKSDIYGDNVPFINLFYKYAITSGAYFFRTIPDVGSNQDASAFKSSGVLVFSNGDYQINTIETLFYNKSKADTLLDAKVDKTQKVNGHALSGDITLDKGDVGLGNVDNTSDANKPISNATQSALDLKVDKSSIVDNTTTNDDTKVLSAKQGKALRDDLGTETTNRQNADNNLQSQIDGINAGQNLADIVADLTALGNLDTTKLQSGDKVEVLSDSNHDNVSTVYNWNGTAFVYIGAYGMDSYTKAQMDTYLANKQDKIDSSHKLSSDLVDDTGHTNKFVTEAQKVKIDNAYGPSYVGEDTSTNILAKGSNTGIWKATDNNHWYYWNGSAYVDGGVYQTAVNYDELEEDITSTNGYVKQYLGENSKYFNEVIVSGTVIYVRKDLVTLSVKKGDKVFINSSVSGASTDKPYAVYIYDSENTQLAVGFYGANDYVNISQNTADHILVVAYPAHGTALPTGTATFSNVLIYVNELHILENIKYAPFDNFKQEYDSFINKYRPYNIRLKSSSYVNPVYLIDNHIFSCEKVNLVSNGIVTEGIEILCVPPIKNAWVYAKASRNFGTDFISRITITMDDNTTSTVRTFTSGETISIYIPENAIQIVFTFPICWSYDTILEENQEVEINDIDIWYEDGVKETVGKGNLVYKGYEKINLGLNQYHCKVENIDVKTFAEWQEIIGNTSSITNNCQSMAIYNDYVFNFSAYNDVYISSLTDSSYEYHANFPNSAHCNSAQFINVFYDENDTYPLLLISNCEINDAINWNTMSVIRVTESNGVFTFTLVKTITFVDNSFKWGGSIAFDEAHNRFVSMTNKNGAYNVWVNNPNMFLTFDAPNSWTDGVDETLTNGKLLFELPSHLVLQSLAINNNRLIFGAQISTDNNDYWRKKAGFGGTSVFVYDLNGELKNIVKVNRSEIEGVYVYKDELYCQSHLSISTNVNAECLWVDKYTF